MSTPVLDLDMALSLAGEVVATRGRYAVPVRRGERLRLRRHPGSPDPADLKSVRRWIASITSPTAIDLFCGAGGLSLGLEASGFRVLAGADKDSLAVETHAANLPSLPYLGDLTDPEDLLEHLDSWGIRTVDLVAGGVPCQPFSRAGRAKIRSLVEARVRAAEDTRADLWQSFVRVVERLRPRAVLLENVPDLAVWDEGAVLVGFCDALHDMGYQTDARILHAYEYGVPQHRSRLFIVGVEDGVGFDWPTPDPGPQPTLWDAIGDLPTVEGGQIADRLPYDGPITGLQAMLRTGMPEADIPWVYDHITRHVRPDDLEAYRSLRPGGTYKDVPESLRRYRSDSFSDKYKRLSKAALSRTIAAHMARDGYWYIHPVQDRTLSVREAARIQTFPDWFRFAGEPSHRYRQVGNAVPPFLAAALGRQLLSALARGPRRRSRQRTSISVSRESQRAIRRDLLAWHSANARHYPWRSGESPWLVLLSEMCLHRTRADQVETIYGELAGLAPTPSHLLTNSARVETLLSSLGLRWRSANILKVARELVDNLCGEVPDTRERLLALPGVGDYVASAVLCFAFGKPSILLDTNTVRVISRLTGREVSGHRWQLRLDLNRLAGPRGADREFNYALLDLGALVCRASSPRCLACPLSSHCGTFRPQAV